MIDDFKFIIERYIADKIPLMYVDTYDYFYIKKLILCNKIPSGFYTWGDKATYDPFMYNTNIIDINVKTGLVALGKHIKNDFVYKLIKKSCYEWSETELAKFIMLTE